jgi:hypothetical protein
MGDVGDFPVRSQGDGRPRTRLNIDGASERWPRAAVRYDVPHVPHVYPHAVSRSPSEC